MISKKTPFILVGLCFFSYLIFFQNCSSGTNFTTASNSSETPANQTTAPIANNDPTSGNLDLKITHINGNRGFLINIKNINITDAQCRLQFQKDGSTWVDLQPEFSCNTDTGAQTFYLPTEDNWTNNFNATGVQIRVVKALATKPVVGLFTDRLKCAPQAGTANQTPNVDENCNGKWDDSNAGAEQTCDVDSGAVTFGSTYSCAPTSSCSGTNGTFKLHRWIYSTGMYSESDCKYQSIILNAVGPYQKEESTGLTGTAPTHYYAGSLPNFCESYEGFSTTNSQKVLGYANFIPQWSQAKCVYSYYPSKLYY